MGQRLRAVAPLAITVGILTFVWLEVSLNFTLHRFTNGDQGKGLSLPNNFQLVTPVAFISWAMFFAAGSNRSAARRVPLASCLDHFLIVNERHLHGVLTGWQMHYNGHRPHQGREQQAQNDQPCRVVDQAAAIQRRPVLGGLINEYHRAA